MAVYVDALHPCLATKNWKWDHSCHLLADSDEELHKFAVELGLKREWFQGKRLKHYDLTAGKRHLAVKYGAKEVDNAEFAALMRKQWKGYMKSNREAVLTVDFLKTWFRAFRRKPLVMVQLTFFVIVAFIAIKISNWVVEGFKKAGGDEKRIKF